MKIRSLIVAATLIAASLSNSFAFDIGKALKGKIDEVKSEILAPNNIKEQDGAQGITTSQDRPSQADKEKPPVSEGVVRVSVPLDIKGIRISDSLENILKLYPIPPKMDNDTLPDTFVRLKQNEPGWEFGDVLIQYHDVLVECDRRPNNDAQNIPVSYSCTPFTLLSKHPNLMGMDFMDGKLVRFEAVFNRQGIILNYSDLVAGYSERLGKVTPTTVGTRENKFQKKIVHLYSAKWINEERNELLEIHESFLSPSPSSLTKVIRVILSSIDRDARVVERKNKIVSAYEAEKAKASAKAKSDL